MRQVFHLAFNIHELAAATGGIGEDEAEGFVDAVENSWSADRSEGEAVPHNTRLEAGFTIEAHYPSLETALKAENWQVLIDGLPDIPNLRDSRSVDILAGDFYYWHGRPWADSSCPNVPSGRDATV